MQLDSGIRCLAALATLFAGVLSSPAIAQASDWPVAATRGKTAEVRFETDEGTWMSVDISPDGRWIVFDLMGHIYRMPAGGGRAESLTQGSGAALNFHPRFSPDGRQIAFISDRGGQENIWVMDADGSAPRLVFRDLQTRFNSPHWLPDGSAIVAVREFPTYSSHRRSARVWLVPTSGAAPRELVGAASGSGVQAYWPTVSPDGRYVYYMYATFAEPLDGRQRQQHIRRIDLATGEVSLVTQPFGARKYWPGTSADLAPEISPDGRWISFARRLPGGSIKRGDRSFSARTALWIRNLETGEERVIADEMTLDMQGAHGMKNQSVLPQYSWSPDSQSLVMWNLGHLRRVGIDGRIQDIPFTAEVRRTVSEMARWTRGIDETSVPLKNLRWPVLSRTEKRLVFEAAGEIWSAPSEGAQAKAVRLVQWRDDVSFAMPSLAPDDRTIAFVSWNDRTGGDVLTCRIANCTPVAVSRTKGAYLFPTWAPDGRSLYAIRPRDPERLNYDLVKFADAQEMVVKQGVPPGAFAIGPDDRMYFFAISGRVDRQAFLTEGRTIPKMAAAMNSVLPGQGGAPPRQEIRVDHAQFIAPSPNKRWVAYIRNVDLYVAPWPDGQAVKAEGEEYHWVGPPPPAIPENDAAWRISNGGAQSARWLDTDTLSYSQGDRIYVYDARTGRSTMVRVDATLPADIPAADQSIVFKGARIVTLGPKGVIENGSVLVTGARITCVGDCVAPAGANIVDASGKTIIPGFVDVHAHGSPGYQPTPDLASAHPVPDALYLSYGITTRIDPGGLADYDYAGAELIKAGRAVGARAYSAGEPIDADEDWPNSRGMTYDDTGRIVRRIAERGATSIKVFLTPRRDHRQMLIDQARRQGLSVTNEGADLYYNMSLMIDGSTGWEHLLHYDALYKDALQFFGQTRAAYSPTIQVAGAGLWAEEYWQAHTDLLHEARLRRFLPWSELVRRIGAPVRPATDYPFALHAASIRDLRKAGALTPLGGHGELWGIDTHWDMWSYAFAMPAIDILSAASMDGARRLGLERDIGSLEPGKLGDLLVLSRNPLEDIKNTESIVQVMKGGILYDSLSLDRVWPTRRAYGAGAGEDPNIYVRAGHDDH